MTILVSRVLPILLALLAMHGWAQEQIQLSAEQIKSLGITVGAPQPQAQGAVSGLNGRVVVPNTQLHLISTPLPGLVETLAVALNEPVKRGQALVRLQSPAFLEAQRSYLQATSQARLASANLARDEQLLKDGIIPDSRFRATQSAHLEAMALLAERRHELKLAGMSDRAVEALVASQSLSSALVLTAPADGTVLEQMATVGQRLDAFTAIYKIGRLDPLWLEIHAAVARVAGVREGAPVSVPGTDARGRIISVGRAVDPDSQTVMLRALITENARNLRPGQNVEVSVAGVDTGTEPAWRVPNEALVRQGGKVYLFVRSAQGFQPVAVRLLQEGAKDSAVAGALTERSEVALTGASALKARMMGLGGTQ
jgi:multidrug efflux pump subunit AcrA (membrane-fusion protein)